MNKISKAVNEWNTKNPQGFMQSEIDELLTLFPNINKEKFDDALMGNTCMMIDGELIMYHCDIEKAIRCGIENRNLRDYEWD